MASLKDEVLAKLAAIAAPDGRPLPATGTLSEIVASGGKVFFSITVDAAQVRTWEHVRASAERAVRSIPGVQSAMVALTGERTGGGGSASAPPVHEVPRNATRSHWAIDPLRHQRHSPHPMMGQAAMRSPDAKSSTPAPIAVTSPDISWPMITGACTPVSA